MQKQHSIRRQLNIFMFIIMSTIIVIVCFAAISIFFSVYESDIEQNVKMGVEALEANVMEDSTQELLAFTHTLVDVSEDIFDLKDTNRKAAWSNYINHSGSKQVELVQIWDHDSIVYESSTAQKISIVNYRPINDENTTILIKASKDSGIYMISSAPIRDDSGAIVGQVRVASQLADQNFIANIKNVTGLDATIFAENIRFVTTIEQNGVLQTGTSMNLEVQNTVLVDGKEYIGKTDILGDPYIVAYIPVLNENGRPIGALFVGKSIAAIYAVRLKLILYLAIIGSLIFFVSFNLSRKWVLSHITNPVYLVSQSMKKITEEDYDSYKNLPKATSKEIENLHQSMEVMVTSILTEKEKLETVAYTDSVTGLWNRECLYERYKDISMVNNGNTLTVIYYLDLDNLKYVNHLFGQTIGDKLISQVAVILNELISLYSEYQIYRVAGDEFVICKEGDFHMEEIMEMAKKIRSLFEDNFIVEQYNISMTASVGVAYTNFCNGQLCDECDGHCKDTLESLFKKAEIAMNRVKATGKNNFLIFDPNMNESIQHKALLQQELKAALQNGELLLYYQPKYNLKEDGFDGFEALIRWNHPKRGFIPPSEFIGVAEESNLINEIGAWVLESACIFIKEFNQTYQKNFNVAVNVSFIQFFSDGFEEYVCNILEKYGLDPRYLELEITESVFVNSMDIASEKLRFFRNMGISIALDDFGTGYSSLTYLKELPITTLKLDKSFVDDIVENTVSLTIVESVILIGKSTGLKIIVEGVETYEQLQMLSKLQCDSIQGYYFSKPISKEEILKLFQQVK